SILCNNTSLLGSVATGVVATFSTFVGFVFTISANLTNNTKSEAKAVLERQEASPTPGVIERHG
ncbi:hypothetical protein, partial [Enterococcus faecalis]|uniref:hypothetical protein n=1 Tax=Enterococcus faecalis TaxID=1351 RepID=UPI003D6AC7C6